MKIAEAAGGTAVEAVAAGAGAAELYCCCGGCRCLVVLNQGFLQPELQELQCLDHQPVLQPGWLGADAELETGSGIISWSARVLDVLER